MYTSFSYVYCLVDELFTCLPHDADGPAAEVVVEAEVLVPTDIQELLVGNDKLEGRQEIEEGDANQLPHKPGGRGERERQKTEFYLAYRPSLWSNSVKAGCIE